MINPAFDGEVGTALEALYFALNTPSGTALGCLEGRTIDQEFAFTLVIDVFITFLLIRIFIRVVGGVHQAAGQDRPCFRSSLNCSRDKFRQGPRLSVMGVLLESQLGAPGKLAPSSRMPRLEAPRVRPAKLRQVQRAQAVKRRLCRKSTPRAVEPRAPPPKGVTLEGARKFMRHRKSSSARAGARRRTCSGQQMPPETRQDHTKKQKN